MMPVKRWEHRGLECCVVLAPYRGTLTGYVSKVRRSPDDWQGVWVIPPHPIWMLAEVRAQVQCLAVQLASKGGDHEVC